MMGWYYGQSKLLLFAMAAAKWVCFSLQTGVTAASCLAVGWAALLSVCMLWDLSTKQKHHTKPTR